MNEWMKEHTSASAKMAMAMAIIQYINYLTRLFIFL